MVGEADHMILMRMMRMRMRMMRARSVVKG
jgi:hypothetical protein